MVSKYGCEWGEWSSLTVSMPYGVALWRGIMNGWDASLRILIWCHGGWRWEKGEVLGSHVVWDVSLRISFLSIYSLARDKEASFSSYLNEGDTV